jgi:C1A family cysteine protease
MTKKIKLAILFTVICMTASAQKGFKNPAAAYCEFLGYRYSVQTDKQGNETGVCTLPTGGKVNAWDFYKGKVAKEFSYAAKKGYKIETVTETIDGYVTETAVCTRDVKGVQERLSIDELMEKNGDKLQLETRGPSKDIYEIAKEDPNFKVSKANPTSFDWRSYNGHSYIGPIRDQGSCGSCYAFGATACAEGTYNFATGKYDSNTSDFAESYIIWCLSTLPAYSSHFGGCAGADYSYSELQALVDIGTIPESYFPYSPASGQSCPSAASTAPKTKFNSWYRVPCSDVEAIKTAIMTHGVVDAAVYVTSAWQKYSGGIFSNKSTTCTGNPCENTTTNHAIALVGWGHDATAGDYWILRNSWGSSWGENGYMRTTVKSGRLACSVCYMVYQNTIMAPSISNNSENSTGNKLTDKGSSINANATVPISVSVYPNPTNNTINVKLNNGANLGALKIFNTKGSLVKTETIDKAERTIDVSDLPAGVYIISVDGPKEPFTTRFIKK